MPYPKRALREQQRNKIHTSWTDDELRVWIRLAKERGWPLGKLLRELLMGMLLTQQKLYEIADGLTKTKRRREHE